jgi:predicted amidohydrolase YtcJ
MEAGITSKDPGGANPQAMLANYTLDLPTLLRAHTVNAAYQLFLENETGVLATGKRGDLIVVNQDPFKTPVESLHKTVVLTTYLDGQVVYRRPSAPMSARNSDAATTH